MSSVLQRAAGFFLVPAAAQRTEAAALPPAARAVVLGAPSDAAPLAAAVALSLRAAACAPVALVAMWDPLAGDEGARPAAATRAAAGSRPAWLPATCGRRPRAAGLARAPGGAGGCRRGGPPGVGDRRGAARHHARRAPPGRARRSGRRARPRDPGRGSRVATRPSHARPPGCRGVAGSACAPLGRGPPERSRSPASPRHASQSASSPRHEGQTHEPRRRRAGVDALVGALAAVLVGVLVLGAVARGVAGRPRRSERWTSPRSPGRGRCTRPTRGCSSPRRSTASRTRAI